MRQEMEVDWTQTKETLQGDKILEELRPEVNAIAEQ